MRLGILPVGNRDQIFPRPKFNKTGNILKNGFYQRILHTLIVSEMRKFILSKLYQTVPYGSNITNDHSLCEKNNQFETFSKCVSRLLAEFFSTWKLLSELNSSPRERSNHTKIIKIQREKPFQTLFSLAKLRYGFSRHHGVNRFSLNHAVPDLPDCKSNSFLP